MENDFKRLKGNSRSLYNLVSYLIQTKMDNPMPEHSSDRELANEFVNVLWRKLLQYIMTLKTYLCFAALNTI